MGILHTKTVSPKKNFVPSPTEEAVIFDFLIGETTLHDTEIILKTTSTKTPYAGAVAVIRLWIDHGLIHMGRIEADIKKRLAAEEAKNGRL